MEKKELLLLLSEKLNGRSQDELKLVIKLIDEILNFVDKKIKLGNYGIGFIARSRFLV
ncbi:MULTISPECIES: hypothetical protein [Lysinibacillus]|uniref:hypothetical protein n=1 Tax=Lysinibacillus TaxID=400634 RepID=UPI002FDD080E